MALSETLQELNEDVLIPSFSQLCPILINTVFTKSQNVKLLFKKEKIYVNYW